MSLKNTASNKSIKGPQDDPLNHTDPSLKSIASKDKLSSNNGKKSKKVTIQMPQESESEAEVEAPKQERILNVI